MQDVSCVHTCCSVTIYFINTYHVAWVKTGSKLSSYLPLFIVPYNNYSSLCCIILSVVITPCSTKRGWTALMRAAEGGRNVTVQTLIAAGADVSLKVRL